LYFLLLREWLKVCDESYDDHVFIKEDNPLLTRVLDIGDVGNLNRCAFSLLMVGKEDILPYLIARVELNRSLLQKAL
jgi:hypothetical protein